MVDLFSYLGLITNSFIRCIDTTLTFILNIPIFDITLGGIIYSFIFIIFALNIFSKWIYKKRHVEGDEE